MLIDNFIKYFNENKIHDNQIIVATFYKFIQLKKKLEIRTYLLGYTKFINIKGTILLANEGINGTIAGKKKI